jgi:hypothetical protein
MEGGAMAQATSEAWSRKTGLSVTNVDEAAMGLQPPQKR